MRFQRPAELSVQTPLVSVCITSYNYGRFLGQTLDSCFAQTYPHIEVILVDDGSTDDSRKVITSYGAHVISVFQENQGQTAAALRGLDMCTGEIVAFLDSDDVLYPGTIATAVGEFLAQPGLSRVQWRLRIADADLKVSSGTVPPLSWTVPSGDLRSHVLSRRTYVWPPTSGNAYARWALDVVTPHIDRSTRYIDFALAETTAIVGPVANLDAPGGIFRKHGGNTTSSRTDVRDVLRTQMDNVLVGHQNLRRVASALGLACPVDPRAAADWAFAQYRLASLRLDPANHPYPGERPLGVAWQGIRAVAGQPWMALRARLKRIVLFLLLASVPRQVAEDLTRRALRNMLPEPAPEERLAAYAARRVRGIARK